MEEDEVNTCSGCYVKKLYKNLALLVWLEIYVESIKRMEILYLQIFVDQLCCLMSETISYYNSDFPVDFFNSDSSVHMEIETSTYCSDVCIHY